MKNLYHTICALIFLTIAFNGCKLDKPVTPTKDDVIPLKGYHAPTGTDPDDPNDPGTGTGTDPDDPGTGTGTDPDDPGTGVGNNKGEGLPIGATNTVVVQVDGGSNLTFDYASFTVKSPDGINPYGSITIIGLNMSTLSQFYIIIDNDSKGVHTASTIDVIDSKIKFGLLSGGDRVAVANVTDLSYTNPANSDSSLGTLKGTFNGSYTDPDTKKTKTIKGSFNIRS